MPSEPYCLVHADARSTSGPVISDRRNISGGTTMTTINGLFTAGDGCSARVISSRRVHMLKGGLPVKRWSPTAWTRGQSVDFSKDTEELAEIYMPMETFGKYSGYSTDPTSILHSAGDVQQRLQKVMDEYVGGVATGT